ncbi:tigger transposable element-derived protein 6-like [Tetranychus urticae]|uniref:tigger transposable element-derived protein 6-like n=1 Tax=Tetranychus urticae TaxID=32264 RepID=UPI00077B860D|nr:tigger transposable element-derived protein 6-like [Tetranychus urticae]
MRRKNLTIKEKNLILDEKENQPKNVLDLSFEFNVSKWTINRTLKQKKPLQEAFTNGQGKITRLQKNTDLIEFDSKVKAWIMSCASKGIPISATMIIEYTKQISNGTKGSWGWFLCFKKRINLKLGSTSCERLSINLKIVENWRNFQIPTIMINWQHEFIYNCDETALFWRQTPVKTYFISKTEHIGDKLFHERITILFCVNRNGDKLAPLVISRSAKPRCFYSNCLKDLDLKYVSQINSWMNREIFYDWVSDLHSTLVQQNKKILLLLDNFRGHNIQQQDFPLITFKFLPAGTTSLTQPLDGGIIKSFKSKYLSLFMKNIIENIDANHISDVVKKINILNALNWVDQSWKNISSETITNCWCHFKYFDSYNTNESHVNSDNDEVPELLSALNQLNLNCCSYDDLLDQNNFDFVNFFYD